MLHLARFGCSSNGQSYSYNLYTQQDPRFDISVYVTWFGLPEKFSVFTHRLHHRVKLFHTLEDCAVDMFSFRCVIREVQAELRFRLESEQYYSEIEQIDSGIFEGYMEDVCKN